MLINPVEKNFLRVLPLWGTRLRLSASHFLTPSGTQAIFYQTFINNQCSFPFISGEFLF